MIRAKLLAMTFPIKSGEQFFTITVEDSQSLGGDGSDYTVAINGNFQFGYETLTLPQVLERCLHAKEPITAEFLPDLKQYQVVKSIQFNGG